MKSRLTVQRPDVTVAVLGTVAFTLLLGGFAASGITATSVFVTVIGAFLLITSRPKLALVTWMLAACFVPYWSGLTAGGYLPPTTLLSLAVIPGILWRRRVHLHLCDYAVLIGSLLIALLAFAGTVMGGHAFVAVTQWALAYLVGRALVQETGSEFAYTVITYILAAVAVMVLIEFTLGWNPYYGTAPDTAQYAKIGAAQARGGATRAEWAFGHSIALANSLALAVPLILLSTRRPQVRVLLVAVIGLAVAVTFSRSGLVSFVLATALTLWAGRKRVPDSVKFGLIGSAVLAGLSVFPAIANVFGSAGGEASRSGEHRLRLFGMIGRLNPWSTADGYSESLGVFNWDGIVSIDNAFIRIAVNYGYLIAIACLIGLAALTATVVVRQTTAPAISIVAITPALFTVALITQFGSLVWFFVGIAVSSFFVEKSTAPANSPSIRATSSMTGQ